VATLATQLPAFTYLDSRDLSGFEDGTENPSIAEAPAVTAVADGEPGAGGSIVLVQRWVHHLGAFHAPPLEEQERIIGRTKATSEELPEDVRPATSHISRVVIEEDGEELEIFRRSTSYGDVREHGLLFVGFSRSATTFHRMLERMVGNDGPRDALTTWSTPVSGAYYYAPPLEAFAAAG
jgi:putative iron-dependent peroxidase